MEQIYDFLVSLDAYIGGHTWFIVLLLGTGIFFTIYLKFPQFRYFRHAIRIVMGKYDKAEEVTNRVLKIDKNHHEAKFNLGVIAVSQGEKEKARKRSVNATAEYASTSAG